MTAIGEKAGGFVSECQGWWRRTDFHGRYREGAERDDDLFTKRPKVSGPARDEAWAVAMTTLWYDGPTKHE